MGEYEPEDSRNVTGTASTPDGRWTNKDGKPPAGVPDSHPHRAHDAQAEPNRAQAVARQEDLAPEDYNPEQDDEQAQAQTIAAQAGPRAVDDLGLSESTKPEGDEISDDAQDLVDKMRQMNRSGRLDMDAYRGERNDDDEEGMLGPQGEE